MLDADPGRLSASLDLGLTRIEIRRSDQTIRLPAGRAIDVGRLSKSFSAPEDCILLGENTLRKAYLYSEETGKYYKLYQPTEDVAPTVVIASATMHSIVDMMPWEDAQKKTAALGGSRGTCLDTCFGLGYSAQLLFQNGFQSVVTCEVDRNVLRLARVNPWSAPAFDTEEIDIYEGDVRTLLEETGENSFDAIFHDPPTIRQAGELYSEDIYRRFKNVLRSPGRLYHYVGSPGAGHGQDFSRGVMRRLQEAGFRNTERRERGVIATG